MSTPQRASLRVVPIVRPQSAPDRQHAAATASPAVMPRVRTWEGQCAAPRERAGEVVIVAEHGLVVMAVNDRTGGRVIARKVPAIVSGIGEEVLAIDMLIEQLARIAPAADAVVDLFAVNPHLRTRLAPACTSGQLVNHDGIPAQMHDLHRRAMEEIARHPLEVATDASRSRHRREAGLAAVVETGQWVTQLSSASNINSAEISAIGLAVRRFVGARPLRIRSDSRVAVAAVKKALETGCPTARTSEDTRELRYLLIASEGHRVDVAWVRGHDEDPLNLAADRLAVLARRTSETPASNHHVARRIVTEELTAPPAELSRAA